MNQIETIAGRLVLVCASDGPPLASGRDAAT